MEFGHRGIETNYRTLFAIQPATYGRNSMVRLAYLKISGLDGLLFRDVDKQNDHIWTEWREFFTSKVHYRPMGFPALEGLVLDFTDWRLTAAESSALMVSICTGNPQKEWSMWAARKLKSSIDTGFGQKKAALGGSHTLRNATFLTACLFACAFLIVQRLIVACRYNPSLTNFASPVA